LRKNNTALAAKCNLLPLISVNSRKAELVYSDAMNVTNLPGELTRKELKDLRVLACFIECWCGAQHDATLRAGIAGDAALAPLAFNDVRLCPECRGLLDYAIARRRGCPLDPKPACKDCPIHCYKPVHRAEIRKIMRFSGRHLILRGRLDLLWHYFF
jgi:hypothetical protein